MSEVRAKPRFAPKKKVPAAGSGEASQEPAIASKTDPATSQRDAAQQGSSSSSSSSRSDGRYGGGKVRPEGRGGAGGRGAGGRGGRGRGSYASNPSGKAFFSGDSGALGHGKGVSSSATKGESIKSRPVGAPGVKVKLEAGAKPAIRTDQSVTADQDIISQETIEVADTGDKYNWTQEVEMDPELGGRKRVLKGKAGKTGKAEFGSFQYNIPAEDASSDSDVDAMVVQEIKTEPHNAVFSEAAPRALLDRSPPTVAADALLLSQSRDKEVLEREKDENIFLLQMPSGFALPKRDALHDSDPDVTILNSSVEGKCGKIGKLQLMASGRLLIVLDDGTRFEVNRGLATTFSQYLCAISTDYSKVEAKAAPEATAKGNGSKAAADASHSSGEAYEQGPTRGELYTMGPITAKWTVTPEHDIGELKQLNLARPVTKGPVIKQESEETMGVDVNELYE